MVTIFDATKTDASPKERPTKSAITVNGIEIAEVDIMAEVQNHPAENPGIALRQASEALVVRQLLLQEAERLELECTTQIDEKGRRETTEEALIRTLVETQLEVPRASKEEVRRYYKNNKNKFRTENLYEARHILVVADYPGEIAKLEALEKSKQLIEHLKRSPEDFGSLALLHSSCPSKKQQGNLGQLSRGTTVSEFEDALQAASEPGLLSEPVESRFGYHIIMIDRIIPGQQLPFEQVSERIVSWLENRSWRIAAAQYVQLLADRATITGLELQPAKSFPAY